MSSMESVAPPSVRDVRDHVTCRVCHGYLIDAVTVVRCLHTFCRSCLIGRLTQVNQCPSCQLIIDQTRLSKEIRRDDVIQRVVYKCVPGLLTSELKRRRDFIASRRCCHGDDVTMTSEQVLLPGDMSSMTSLCADDDDVSICLQLIGSPSAFTNDTCHVDDEVRCRYLLCPASTDVSLLKKFVFLKFDLSDQQHSVELFHDGELMEDSYKLMDVAYMFDWNRSSPMTFQYVVISRVADVMSRDETPVTSSSTSRQSTTHVDTSSSTTTTMSAGSDTAMMHCASACDTDCLSINMPVTSAQSAASTDPAHLPPSDSTSPQAEVDTPTSTPTDREPSHHVTSDVTRVAGSCRQKRKSLESVIKSLQPTPVVTSRQPEVARSRPEVLVRPMPAARPSQLLVSTEAVRPIGQLFTPYSQSEPVDLRRPKRPLALTGSSNVAGVGGRRKAKWLCAPSVVDEAYWSARRRRVNMPGTAAAWLTSYYTARPPPLMNRLPVYYGTAEPNGFDAPLELTTPRSRDRK